MDNFTRPVYLRWADIDANRHLRHSVYTDFAAAHRMTLLNERGLTMAKLEELQVGPILFREETIFKREVRLEDKITIDAKIVKSTEDYSRLSMRHQIVKADDTVAAIINVDIAWMDLVKRKLTMPPVLIQSIFASFPMTEEFQWITHTVKQ